ncbi:hypothetical protein PRIPAC_90222 [Pristionchus pacificus]|uniref:RNase H domain-containing protein n=1 Tax=Pristionchus pacificus TaxID=54126 RepID=A0A2A6B5Q4_PRIPA|nr:hypothetical protein PRIPAC_90222 [Pristionchus pacificus]|eukprot:PDM61210.1 hypothetical protein PRIPAC_50652 [Pristionchus pacificus]
MRGSIVRLASIDALPWDAFIQSIPSKTSEAAKKVIEEERPFSLAPHAFVDYSYGKTSIIWPGNEFSTVRLSFTERNVYYRHLKPLQYALSQALSAGINHVFLHTQNEIAYKRIWVHKFGFRGRDDLDGNVASSGGARRLGRIDIQSHFSRRPIGCGEKVARRTFNGKQELDIFKLLWRSMEASDAPVKSRLILEKGEMDPSMKPKEVRDISELEFVEELGNAIDRLKESIASQTLLRSVETVRTTGVRYTARNGIDYSINGVYWGKDDPRNTVINSQNDPTDFQGVMLKSIVKALEQAKADGLKQIHVQSDFRFLKEPDYRKALERLKMRDFATWQGNLVPNAEQYEKILKLWNEFDKVVLEYRPAWHPNRPGNDVMQLLKEEEKKRNPNAIDFTSPDYKCDWEFSPDDTPLAGRMVPTVYVAGKLEVKLNGYKAGSCASLWVPDTIQNLQVKQRPLGSIQRVSIFPVTLFRSQLMAILDALREAQTRKISEIRIITDSLHFMHFFTTGWQKRDGSPVANEKLFLKIKALTEEITVHFKGVKYEEDCEDDLLKKVHEMASDGLGYPMNNRDTKEYDMKVEELLEGKNDVYAFEGTSTRRARIFKKAEGCPLGVLWDRMDGVPLEGEEAESADACLVGVSKKTPAAMLLAVLEHADRTWLDTIVIRTNQANLVQATLGFLEVWHRYEWNDRRYGQLKEVETWKRIWEIKERIEIVWDLIVDVDEVKDEIYLAKYRKQVRQKKKTGRPKKKQKGIPE